ncbi:ATP-dependent sacrificial sulfur transferase LarE [Ferrimicrobium sp.]|uniref:ATP-dependent sacrificial sulfur transferase LarE n=1 Tax=Ferrimicrobium sp. TaxID=2926050 RepID=UPI00260E5BCE|nr:ATP-dependent sacrificial sulfur transferase LarE [Ferrimicrobium sp.]
MVQDFDTSLVDAKIEEVGRWFQAVGRVVVALSGGVDSAVLAALAKRTLGHDALAATAVSPSLSQEELDGVRVFARRESLNFVEVQTDEIRDPNYVKNAPDRCYVCKSHLFEELLPIARRRNATIVVGTNLDDLGDYRPGLQAAKEFGVASPFVECGVNKWMIRSMARSLGLDKIAEKPASACLASRIPYGMPVTIQRLSAVERLERFLHRLGLPVVRVRHHGDIARIELPPEMFPQMLANRERIAAEAERLGFLYSTLDLGGFRSGSLNRVLRGTSGDESDRQTLV